MSFLSPESFFWIRSESCCSWDILHPLSWLQHVPNSFVTYSLNFPLVYEDFSECLWLRERSSRARFPLPLLPRRTCSISSSVVVVKYDHRILQSLQPILYRFICFKIFNRLSISLACISIRFDLPLRGVLSPRRSLFFSAIVPQILSVSP